MARMSMADRLKKSGTATVARLDEARKRLQEQSSEQSTEQSSEQSVERSEEQLSGHSGGQSDTVADIRAVTVTDSLTDTHKDTPKVTQKSAPKHIQKSTLTDSPGNNPYFWMTPNQAAVLSFLNTIPSGKTRLDDICNGTGVPYGTVRKALVALERYDCITKPRKIRIGQWQGMHVELLESGRKWNTLQDSQTDCLSGSLQDTPLHGQSGGHSGGHSPISSSSYLNKTTTINLKQILETHPELGYWRQKGLTTKQINTWSKQFDLDPDHIIQSLCYCRFDMVDNGREKSEPINDVFNWFFRMIERTGSYPIPSNYKSHQEKQIEREKERVAELRKQAEELRKVRQEAINAQHELEFEQILHNEEHPTYRQCFDKLPEFLKKPGKQGSLAFVNAMKKSYCELNDIELF